MRKESPEFQSAFVNIESRQRQQRTGTSQRRVPAGAGREGRAEQLCTSPAQCQGSGTTRLESGLKTVFRISPKETEPRGTTKLSRFVPPRLSHCCALHIQGSERKPTEACAYCSVFGSCRLKKSWFKWSLSKENLEINNAGIVSPCYCGLPAAA